MRTKRPITPAITTTISPNRTDARAAFFFFLKANHSWLIPRNPKPTNQEENFLFCQSPLSPNHTTPRTPHPAPPPPTNMDSSNRARPLPPESWYQHLINQLKHRTCHSHWLLHKLESGRRRDDQASSEARWGIFKYYCKSLTVMPRVRRNQNHTQKATL